MGGWQHRLAELPSDSELLVAVAAHLQGQVFDGQGSEPWGQAWPVCPGHPHPPVPREIDGEAVLVCPRDGGVLAAIGRLVEGGRPVVPMRATRSSTRG
jgi:hypothetical protein